MYADLAHFHDQLDLARAHFEVSKPIGSSLAKAMFRSELEYDLGGHADDLEVEIPRSERIDADTLRLAAAGFRVAPILPAIKTLALAAERVIDPANFKIFKIFNSLFSDPHPKADRSR